MLKAYRCKTLCIPLITFLAVTLFAADAYAYVGPGAGLTVIGSLLSVGAAVLLAIVGFIWYPVRRLLRTLKAGQNKNGRIDNNASDRG